MTERFEVMAGGAVATAITIGRGLLGDPAEALLRGRPRRAAAVFAQASTEAIARHLASQLADGGVRTEVEVLPDGDAAKTLDVVAGCYRRLNAIGLRRDDVVIAIGGGALTDTAGFVAATYLRGVAAVYVPTTLLGAVDAAIGGKTGINLDGKNLVGSFRHPEAVVIDLDVLDALPPQLKREGTAEAVKTGFIADPELVAAYESDGLDAPLDVVVPRAVAVKVAVVNEDFTEQGRRALLNYGHTVGHAIETAAGLRHGPAIAVGMVAAAAVSETEAGFAHRERHDALIARLGLPTRAPGLDATSVTELIRFDKKHDASGLRMVLLEDIGKATIRVVEDATVRSALAAVGIT